MDIFKKQLSLIMFHFNEQQILQKNLTMIISLEAALADVLQSQCS